MAVANTRVGDVRSFEVMMWVTLTYSIDGRPVKMCTMAFAILSAVEFLRHVRNENKSLQRETDKLRAEIRVLTADIK